MAFELYELWSTYCLRQEKTRDLASFVSYMLSLCCTHISASSTLVFFFCCCCCCTLLVQHNKSGQRASKKVKTLMAGAARASASHRLHCTSSHGKTLLLPLYLQQGKEEKEREGIRSGFCIIWTQYTSSSPFSQKSISMEWRLSCTHILGRIFFPCRIHITCIRAYI